MLDQYETDWILYSKSWGIEMLNLSTISGFSTRGFKHQCRVTQEDVGHEENHDWPPQSSVWKISIPGVETQIVSRAYWADEGRKTSRGETNGSAGAGDKNQNSGWGNAKADFRSAGRPNEVDI